MYKSTVTKADAGSCIYYVKDQTVGRPTDVKVSVGDIVEYEDKKRMHFPQHVRVVPEKLLKLMPRSYGVAQASAAQKRYNEFISKLGTEPAPQVSKLEYGVVEELIPWCYITEDNIHVNTGGNNRAGEAPKVGDKVCYEERRKDVFYHKNVVITEPEPLKLTPEVSSLIDIRHLGKEEYPDKPTQEDRRVWCAYYAMQSKEVKNSDDVRDVLRKVYRGKSKVLKYRFWNALKWAGTIGALASALWSVA